MLIHPARDWLASTATKIMKPSVAHTILQAADHFLEMKADGNRTPARASGKIAARYPAKWSGFTNGPHARGEPR